MPNILYLCLITLQDNVEFGLRGDKEFYYLDLLVTMNNELMVFEKYKVKKKVYKNNKELTELKDNDKNLLILKDIISQFLLNVKSEGNNDT